VSLLFIHSSDLPEESLLKIQSPSKPNEYRALGLVKGQFLPGQDHGRKGLLVTPEQPFPASLSPQVRKPPTTEAIWRVWIKTTTNQEGLWFFLKSYVGDAEKNPIPLNSLEQDYFSIRGQLLWWNTEGKEDPRFAVKIAPNNPQQTSFKPFFILIYGTLSNPQKGAFWDVSATREGNRLVILEAQEVYPPRQKRSFTTTTIQTVTTDELYNHVVSAIGQDIGKSTVSRWLSQEIIHERLASYCGRIPFQVEFAEKSGNKNFYHLKHEKPKKKSKRSSASSLTKEKSQSSSANSQVQLTVSPTIMVKGRIPEITVKFNEKIEIPSEGKKISIEVQGENEVRVRALLNRKTLKKQVAKMEEYEEWVGALSGKITQISPEGVIELEAAGVQVFEKKKKEKEST